MPVYSMTGYGSGQSEGLDSLRIHVEIRSVNNRFLDLSFKLPEDLRALESGARDKLTQAFKRGKLEVRAAIAGEQLAMTQPNATWLQELARWQSAVQAHLPQARALSVADVLRLSAPQSDVDASANATAFASALNAAIAALRLSRATEGQRLAQMLLERVANLRALALTAAPLVPAAVAQQQRKFLEKFEQALKTASNEGAATDSTTAQERALSEAASYAIRIDVAEELNRLNAHLDEIDTLIAGGGELGKRLDFLIQELHREANTLGSKASSMELSRISVDMRVLVEQMREQVQNIE